MEESWASHATGKMRNAYTYLIGKTEMKRPLARARRRWKGINKIASTG
jgi:hypothetical protein